MTTTQRVLGIVVVAAAAIALYVLLGRDDDRRTPAAGAPSATVGTNPSADPRRASTTTAEAAPPSGRRTGDRPARDRVAEAIRLARGRRVGAPAPGAEAVAQPAAAAPTLPPAAGTLDRDTIRDAVKEMVPLITECYEAALEQRPDLKGSLVVEFTIEGEPDIGGVVGRPRSSPSRRSSTRRWPSASASPSAPWSCRRPRRVAWSACVTRSCSAPATTRPTRSRRRRRRPTGDRHQRRHTSPRP
ncbi:MAG: hypothetical protein R2939_05520 [Kofleriaceae bacterium]